MPETRFVAFVSWTRQLFQLAARLEVQRSEAVRKSICCLGLCFMLACGSSWAAAEDASRVQLTPRDVIVTNGALRGGVVDQNGQPVADCVVWLADKQANILAGTRTDASGRYQLQPKSLREGVVVVGDSGQRVRLWTRAAPPKAVEQLTIVVPGDIVRGEDTLFGVNPATTAKVALVAAALVGVAIAVDDDDAPASP